VPSCHRRYHHQQQQQPPPPPTAAASHASSSSQVLCPAEEVRIKLVADPEYAPGALGALLRMSREKGVLASLSGFPAMCAKQVPYTMGTRAASQKRRRPWCAAIAGQRMRAPLTASGGAGLPSALVTGGPGAADFSEGPSPESRSSPFCRDPTARRRQAGLL